MKTRLFFVFVLVTSLALWSAWVVSAQGPKPTPTPVRGKVLPPPPEPASQPKDYNPQVELLPASDLDSIKPFARAAMPLAGTSAAPRSPRALGQPGFSLRYVQSFGIVEQAYISDTTHINYPYGIGTDGTNVWIAESLGDRALKYASDGTYLMQIGKAGFRYGVSGSVSLDWPADVAVDGSGNIWVVEQGADQVYKFNSSGGYVSALGQSWTCGTGTNQFCNPRGVAFDSSNNTYVSDGDNHRVQVFNSSNAYIATIGTGVAGSANNQFRNPRHIAIYSNYLYVADAGNNRVQIWNITNPASASYFATIGTGVAGSGNDQLNYPMGVAVDANKIYVADGNNHRVQIFDRTTRAYQNTIGTGTAGSANGQFNFPADVAVDSSGNIYVAEFSNNSRVQMFDSSRTYVRTFGTTGVPYVTDGSHYNQPSGIAIAGDGSMYVTEARGQRLLKLNSAGTVQWTIGEAGVGSGVDNAHLNYPGDVDMDSSGRVYVADSSNHRVQIFDSAGAYVATMGVTGSSGTGNDRFNTPQGIAVDSSGNIYVADRYNHRVQIFNSSRAYVATLGVTGVWGTDNAHFNEPYDVDVDSAGNIYVADRANHRVQIFDSSRAYVRTLGVTGSSGSNFDRFSNPIAVAVDAAGRTYVSDQWGGRVIVFDSAGAFLTSIGQSGGNRTGQMRQVEGMAFDAAGNLYLADILNHRITKHAIGVPGWLQSNLNGFGDRLNFSPSTLAVFNGQLYAGTHNNGTTGTQLWRTGSPWTAVMTGGYGDASNYATVHLAEFNGNLYASTSAWDYVNKLYLGTRVYRSSNGTTWSPIALTGLDPSSNLITRFAVFNNKIYASTWSITTTHGAEIWRSDIGDSGTWSQVVANGFGNAKNDGIPSMQVYNGYLYAGTRNLDTTVTPNVSTGGQVWRTNDGTTWTPVTTNGFGNTDNHSARSFAVFNGSLYVGTSTYNYATSTSTGGKIFRCSACDGSDWNVVISDGFGDTNNQTVNGLIAFNNALYAVATNTQTGMEVWRTTNGTTWVQINPDGFGNSNNISTYYNNNMVVFNNALYIGASNSPNGGQVWQMLQQLYLPLILR